MPWKSEAQRRKLHAMAERGEISPSVVAEFDRATPRGKKLPYKKETPVKKVANLLYTLTAASLLKESMDQCSDEEEKKEGEGEENKKAPPFPPEEGRELEEGRGEEGRGEVR